MQRLVPYGTAQCVRSHVRALWKEEQEEEGWEEEEEGWEEPEEASAGKGAHRRSPWVWPRACSPSSQETAAPSRAARVPRRLRHGFRSRLSLSRLSRWGGGTAGLKLCWLTSSAFVRPKYVVGLYGGGGGSASEYFLLSSLSLPTPQFASPFLPVGRGSRQAIRCRVSRGGGGGNSSENGTRDTVRREAGTPSCGDQDYAPGGVTHSHYRLI
jgi:hypothetical protein